MTQPFSLRAVLQSACVFGVTLATLTVVAHGVAAQAMDAAAHKQMMNDASDAQEDFRFALSDKDQKAAIASLTKLEAFMGQTETYWTAKKASDGVKLAKDARASAAAALAAAKANNMAAAKDAFDKMGATCNTCHELHLEKR
jgi:heterodisulfide reductase subunit B